MLPGEGCGPLLPGPDLGTGPLWGGPPAWSILRRSSLKPSSFFDGRSLALSLLCGGRSRAAPRSLRERPSEGERELAEDTGLARSAYMSSESALRTELLLEDAEDTDETLLTLRDLDLREPERERESELEEYLDLELEPL